MADWESIAKKTWFLPSAAAFVWWVIRLATLGQVSFENGIAVGALTNFALLIVMVFVQDRRSAPGAHFLERLKANMKPAVLFACFAALSVGVLHHGVASEATSLRKLERERFIETSLSDESAFLELQETNPQLATLDMETTRERALDSLQFQFNPLWHITASLLALLAAALSTTLFVTFMGQVLRS